MVNLCREGGKTEPRAGAPDIEWTAPNDVVRSSDVEPHILG